MSRFIDADMVEYFKTFNPEKGKETIADMAWRSAIDAVPTADVVDRNECSKCVLHPFKQLRERLEANMVEVVHGKWIKKDDWRDFQTVCNQCKHEFTEYVTGYEWEETGDLPNYCPYCGADMRGEPNEQIH